jgi:hypothetical protein
MCYSVDVRYVLGLVCVTSYDDYKKNRSTGGSVNISAWFVLKYHCIQCGRSIISKCRPTAYLRLMSRSIMQLYILMDLWIDRQTLPWVYGHKEGVLLNDQFYTFLLVQGSFFDLILCANSYTESAQIIGRFR